MREENKYILVTGAYGGMGRAFIEKAANYGYSVFALDNLIPSRFTIKGVTPIICDITKKEAIDDAYTLVSQHTNALFAIIHFAGLYYMDSLLEIPDEKWEKIFTVNVTGPYRINKKFYPMLKKGSRIIITTSELATIKPLPFTGLYGITKASLDKYAFSLLMEAQLKGIHVSVIRPGAVKTKMLDKSTSELNTFAANTKLYKTNATRFKNIVDSVETKAIEGDKIAHLVLYILERKKPRFAYSINTNFYLKLSNICPWRLEKYIIRKILE